MGLPKLSFWSMLCLASVALESLTIVVTQLVIISLESQFENTTKYSILQLVALLPFIYFCVNGILAENIFEVFAFISSSFLLIIYVIFQIVNGSYDVKIPSYILLVLVVAWLAVYGFLGSKIYLDMGFRVLMKFQTDRELRVVYKNYQMFLTLLKFDLAFNGILLLVLIMFIFSNGVVALALIPMFFIIVFGGAVLAWFSVRQEIKLLFALFILGLFAQPSYLVFKLIKMTVEGPDDDEQQDSDESSKIAFYWVMGVIGILMRVALIILSFLVLMNFGKGLKEKMSGDGSQSAETRARKVSMARKSVNFSMTGRASQ